MTGFNYPSSENESRLKVIAEIDGGSMQQRPRPGGLSGVRERGRQAALRGRVRTTAVAWYAHAGLTREEWETYGTRLGAVTKSSSWWLGDWVRFGQRHYNGHRFEFASRITGYDEQTLRNFAYVAGRCEFSRRRENLSWSHHAEVAALEPGQQDRWLDEATKHRLSVRQLRDHIRHERPGAAYASGRDGGDMDGQEADHEAGADDALAVVCAYCGATTYMSLNIVARCLTEQGAD